MDLITSFFNVAELLTPGFWLALAGILWVDLLLSGDNALVIAMATRNLPPRQQKIALWGGVGVAVALRVVGAVFASQLLSVPYLAAIGGVILLWIAYKLVAAGDEDHNIAAKASLGAAIATIGWADASMSLDNVIAVAGMAHGDNLLMALGILASIPMVVLGATLISKILGRFPLLVWAGAGLLGWVAGGILSHDKAFVALVGPEYAAYILAAPAIGAVLVLLTGAATRAIRSRTQMSRHPADIETAGV